MNHLQLKKRAMPAMIINAIETSVAPFSKQDLLAWSVLKRIAMKIAANKSELIKFTIKNIRNHFGLGFAQRGAVCPLIW